MDGRAKVESIVRAIEDARQDLLGWEAPWMEPEYESLRIAIDRRLRSVQLAVTGLFDEVAKASTVPPPGDGN